MIIDEKIEVRWGRSTKKHYESKGYIFTKYGDMFEVCLDDLLKNSMVKIRYVCDYCNGKNQIEEKDKYSAYSNLMRGMKSLNKQSCSKCSILKIHETRSNNIPKEKSIQDNFPHLVEQWSTKNKSSYSKYSYGSSKRVWWICDKGHEWEAIICNRTLKGYNCPYCSGKRFSYENSLEVKYPLLSSLEWNYSKNEDLKPSDIAYSSQGKVWWVCSKGHEWEATVASRSSLGKGCPYCSGFKTSIENSLAMTHLYLIKEWNEEKNMNLTPYDISKGTNRKVWWKCSECNHEWEAMVSNRAKGRGCPLCSESKGEKRIRKWLEDNNILFDSQKEFSNLIGTGGGLLSYDFYIPELNILIEYQGEFHDGSGRDYTKINLLVQQEHDRRKKEYAKQNGIELLEIWYWDFDNIEEILERGINYLSNKL